MGLMDRVREQAAQIAQRTQEAAQEGRVKLDEAQAVLREYVNKYPTHGHIQEVENLLAAMEAETGK